MRILITGSTAMQVDSPRKVNQLISNLASLKKCCEVLGHQVEWREVDLGEDLSEFDVCVASLAPFSSWGTRYMGGVLWTIMQHPRVVLTADDWQVRGIHVSAKTLWKRYDYFEKTIWSHWLKLLEGTECQRMEEYYNLLRRGIRYLAYPEWQHDMLVPCWEGGDLSRLRLPARRLTPYDPSPFMERYKSNQILAKERQWVFASLTAKDSWLLKHRFTWPVAKFGNVRQGQLKLPENELMQVYDNSWGVISPPHDVSAAGWFRVRFHMAADAGCVMFCGDDEARVLGSPYSVKLHEVEKLSDDSLLELRFRQANSLAEKSWTSDRLLEVISATLNQS
jgi:hypothetical protein